MCEMIISDEFHKLLENFGMGPKEDLVLEFLSVNLSCKTSCPLERFEKFKVFAEKHFRFLPPKMKSNDRSKESRSKGNEYWTIRKSNEKAMFYYNAAIGEAENDSVELALAYANRSAVNYACGRHNDVINDIDRALRLNYPNQLKHKLLARMAKSLTTLGRYTAAMGSLELFDDLEIEKSLKTKHEIGLHLSKNTHKDVIVEEEDIVPKLTHPPSNDIYCASKAVEVRNGIWGRMVVATENIKPGDVLAVEKAYVSSVYASFYNQYCFDCKKICYSMVPCLGCTEVFYCDEICRRRSWEMDHRIECEMMPTIKSLDNLSCSIALKLLLKMTRQGRKLQKFIDKEEQYYSSQSPIRGFKNDKYSANKTAVMNIHYNEVTFEEMVSTVFQSCLLVLALKKTSFFDDVTKEMDVKVGLRLTKFLKQARDNSMHMGPKQDELPAFRQVSILPFMALINHSCDPNVLAINFQGDMFLLIALQRISPGNEIAMTYGPRSASMPKSLRVEFFVRKGFACRCDPCAFNWPTLSEMMLLDQRNSDVVVWRHHRLLDEIQHSLRRKMFEKSRLLAYADSLTQLMTSYQNNSTSQSPLFLRCKLLLTHVYIELVDMNAFVFK